MVELETLEQLEAFLAERRERLADVQERGAEALSRYDREICYGGDEELAIQSTIRLLSNQIAYSEAKLAVLRKVPRQSSLF